jgi:hypothetical protein
VEKVGKKRRLTGRPRNRWKDEVREVGRLFRGKSWNELNGI